MDCKRFATVRSSPDLYFVGNIRALQLSSGTFNTLSNVLEGINFILFLPLKTSFCCLKGLKPFRGRECTYRNIPRCSILKECFPFNSSTIMSV